MNLRQSTKNKGFTIIEVVLVLAIAGLIFLMVFIALPALQRNQRDTARKNDLGRVQTAVNNAQTNNRGALPALDNSFVTRYLSVGGDEFVDPSGKPYQFVLKPAGDAKPLNIDMTDSGQDNVRIFYTPTTTCAADGEVTTGAGARKLSLRMVLEGGGIACYNN